MQTCPTGRFLAQRARTGAARGSVRLASDLNNTPQPNREVHSGVLRCGTLAEHAARSTRSSDVRRRVGRAAALAPVMTLDGSAHKAHTAVHGQWQHVEGRDRAEHLPSMQAASG